MENIVIGLFCLMVSNMILNLTLDKINETLSVKNVLNTIFKAVVIFVSSLLIYYAGFKNPEVLVVNMDGVSMNLDDALKMVYMAAIVLYGYKSITKLSKLLSVDTNNFEKISMNIVEANMTYLDDEVNENEEVEEDTKEETIPEVMG